MSRTYRVGVLGCLLTISCLTPPSPAAAQGCPEPLGRWPYGTAWTAAVSGGIAYVSSGPSLLVVDISSPAAPVEVGFLDLPDASAAVAVSGSLTFAANGDRGLSVISVADPTTPVEVGVLDLPGSADGVAVVGDLA